MHFSPSQPPTHNFQIGLLEPYRRNITAVQSNLPCERYLCAWSF